MNKDRYDISELLDIPSYEELYAENEALKKVLNMPENRLRTDCYIEACEFLEAKGMRYLRQRENLNGSTTYYYERTNGDGNVCMDYSGTLTEVGSYYQAVSYVL